jgi:hypothetical protein
MAAGGGKPRWGVDIGCGVVFAAGRGGRDLLVAGMGGSDGPVEATTGEKREVDGGVGGV